MRRDRSAKEAAGKGGSQLKANEAAKSIKCKTCFTTFMSTANLASLTEHAQNKHGKTYEQCFA